MANLSVTVSQQSGDHLPSLDSPEVSAHYAHLYTVRPHFNQRRLQFLIKTFCGN